MRVHIVGWQKIMFLLKEGAGKVEHLLSVCMDDGIYFFYVCCRCLMLLVDFSIVCGIELFLLGVVPDGRMLIGQSSRLKV